MDEVIRAIDVGYGNTKFVTRFEGDQIHCSHFLSRAFPGARDTTVDPLGGRRRTVALPINDLFYEVGPEVHLAADNFQPTLLHDNYIHSAEYLAFMRGALHYMQVPTVDLLVLGLPVETFRANKAALEKLATGAHPLGPKRVITVKKALVVAQPQGALTYYAAMAGTLDTIKRQRSLVIDVGTRTFDWLITQGLRLVPSKSHSVNRGTFDVISKIAREISIDIGREFRNFDALDTALRLGKPLTIGGKTYSLGKHKPFIQGVTERVVFTMISAIGDPDEIDNVVLTGGGTHLFRKAVDRALPNHRVQLVAEPLYANVRGFQIGGQDYHAAALAKSTTQQAEEH